MKAIVKAVMNADCEGIILGLEEGEDINSTIEDKMSLLSYASSKGYDDVAILLIERGADVNSCDENKFTALMYAVLANNYEIARILIENGSRINQKNSSKETALILACKRGFEKIASLLLDHKANVKPSDKDGKTALMHSVSMPNIVAKLIDRCDILEEDKEGLNALMHAAKGGYSQSVLLLSNKSIYGKTLLGKTPLIYAVLAKSLDCVKLLIRKGVLINEQDNFGKTALIYASKAGVQSIVKYLLRKMANTEIKDTLGKTALIHAICAGETKVVKILLSRANVDSRDDYGKTPLMYCGQTTHKEILSALIGAGANINAVDHYGKTALMYACEKGSKAIVSRLLETPSATLLESAFGKKAFDYAKELNRKDIIELFENFDKGEALVSLSYDEEEETVRLDNLFSRLILDRNTGVVVKTVAAEAQIILREFAASLSLEELFENHKSLEEEDLSAMLLYASKFICEQAAISEMKEEREKILADIKKTLVDIEKMVDADSQ